MSHKRKVAILGGGAGAISAAYWLSQEGWESEFESITVYQRGWRLGGKSASGRGPNDRIEEHGLHLWFGFYDNSFRTLRGCYQELDRPESIPIRGIEDGFEPSSSFVLMERRPSAWVPWVATFPEAAGIPGDLNEPDRQPLSLVELVERSLGLLRAQVQAAQTGRRPASTRSGVWLEPTVPVNPAVRLEPLRHASARPRPSRLGQLAATVAHKVRQLPLQFAEDALRAALLAALSLRRSDTGSPDDLVGELSGHVEQAAAIVRQHLRPLLSGSDALRRQWYIFDLVLACVQGILTDGLLIRGVNAIDGVDFVDWLMQHGAEEESARSALVTSVIYDLAFAYRHGDPAAPAFSAATALRGVARLFFDYKGAIAYKMRAGMGDVVFAPLYELLRRRGVRFEFFCDVQELELSDDGRSIGSIRIARQLRLRDPDTEYEPLVDVRGLPCWPSEPRWEQLERAPSVQASDLEQMWSSPTAENLTLRAGEDFDTVVLGISVGSLGKLCRRLLEHDPAWRAMIEGLGTVRTQALQLWLAKSPLELGYPVAGATTGGFLEPFDTFADMHQLIERESWDGEVRGIAYLCNVLPTPPGPPELSDASAAARAKEEVRRNALRLLQHDMVELLPGAAHQYPADFRWELLVSGSKTAGIGSGAPEEHGPARLKTQYWRANVDPSDRYVQSLPGTSRLRMRPGESGFANLVLAGDWTDCGLNAGCFEAAVTSGMLASHALWQQPVLDEISGIAHLDSPSELHTHTRPAGEASL